MVKPKNLTALGNMEHKYINSYVILDLETTGLPSLDFNRTKSTEIALVSVLRQHIIDKFNVNKTSKSPNINYIPRTINKLSECIYPQRRISDTASNITGLTNEVLEQFHPFDETLFNILMGCLDRLKKPICIIAHNGLRFDFPILQAEIQKLGKMFPDDIMCADSLPAFKKLFSPSSPEILKDIQPLDEKKDERKAQVASDWDSDEYDEVLMSVTLEAEHFDSENDDVDNIILQENKRPCGNGEWQRKINESTPNRSTRMSSTQISRKGRASCDITPPSTPIKSETTKTGLNAKKKLPFIASNDVPKSFKLIDVYEHLTKKPLSDAHRAENDALALLECMTAIGPTFLDWVDVNSKPFNSVKKLW